MPAALCERTALVAGPDGLGRVALGMLLHRKSESHSANYKSAIRKPSIEF